MDSTTRLGSWELLSVLEGIQQGRVVFSEKQGMDVDSSSKENTEPEKLTGSAEGMAEIAENPAETTEYIAEGLSVGQGFPEDAAMEKEDFI